MMNQATLIYNVAQRTGLPVFRARRAVHALVDILRDTLKKHDSCSLWGIGVFRVKRRASRVTLHFYTRDELAVPASYKVSFKPAPSLKKIVK